MLLANQSDLVPILFNIKKEIQKEQNREGHVTVVYRKLFSQSNPFFEGDFLGCCFYCNIRSCRIRFTKKSGERGPDFAVEKFLVQNIRA